MTPQLAAAAEAAAHFAAVNHTVDVQAQQAEFTAGEGGRGIFWRGSGVVVGKGWLIAANSG